MIQSAVALVSAITKRLYVVIPGVLFSALAVAGELTGKPVVLPPQYFWILALLVAVAGIFLQYHHERLIRIACEERPTAVIGRLLTQCRDLKAAIRDGAVSDDVARQAFSAFVLGGQRVVRERLPIYLTIWEAASVSTEGDAWLEALEALEDALVAIGREL